MTETAQPLAAENVGAQLEQGADAFKAFLNPEQPRDDKGRFAPQEVEQEIEEEEEAQAEPESVDDDEQAGDVEAAEEAQPEAVDLPSSWSKDDAELWQSLPPEAQAKIAEREGQRDAAVNAKFQEAANIRKANEALVNEAAANRDKYAQAIDGVLALVQPQRPTPYDYGYGTEHYNREAYDIALTQYDETLRLVSELQQQRQQLAAQQEAEYMYQQRARHAQIEATAWPKFLADVPELADQSKGRQIVQDVVQYAVQSGIPEDVFNSPDAQFLTSAELHIAWKAMMYDRQKEAAKRVAPKAQPKPAAPPLKPGTMATRQSVDKVKYNKARERLDREGSVEAGAAVFKHLFR